MSDENKKLAVLFADITGSTTLYEKKGDQEALRLVSMSLDVLVELTHVWTGTHIKTIGDEVMSTFPNPDSAARAAMAMQEAHQDLPLAIKIGFHYGPVIQEKGDVFGDAVNVAARMVSLGKRDEIITTEPTVNALSAEFQGSVRHLDTTTVKGKEELIPIYQLIWQDEDLTIMPDQMGTSSLPDTSAVMSLQHEEKIMDFSASGGQLSIGRGDTNGFIIQGPSVSREHGKVEFSRGHCLYTDQSSNGTYIVNDDNPGTPIFVKRETINLTGSGHIFLGHKPAADLSDAIRYRLR